MSVTTRVPRLSAFALLAPGLGLLGLLFGAPLLASLLGSFGLSAGQGSGSFTLAHYADVFTRPALLRALGVSIYFGVAPVLLTLVVSIALALLMRRHFWGRRLFNGLYKIPMAVPGIIAALVMLTLAERGGFLDRVVAPLGLQVPRRVRDDWGLGVILTTAWKQVPFMTLVIGGAFASISEDIVSASRSLGANRWRTLWHVQLPLAMPGISAAVLLTFIGGMGSFAIPDLVGPASPRPLAVHMVAEFGSGNFNLVYAIGMVLSAFSVLVLLGYYALTSRSKTGDRYV